MDNLRNKATLYGVGVGPGDPELMTLKAVRILKSTDVIAIPTSDHSNTAYHIASQAVPELAQKESCRLVFPMTRDAKKREQAFQTNASRLISFLADGKSVAFPVLGDPSIYSTYTYVSRLVAAAGYPAVTVPGIPSFSAAAAAAGRSLGEDDMQIHIFPVLRSRESEEHGDRENQTSDFPVCAESGDPVQNFPGSPAPPASVSDDFSSLGAALSLPGRKILMKGGRFSGQVRDELLARKLPAVMVENCGMENEKIYWSPEEFPEQAGYYSIILL